ncbi:winged helix-turn-helix domain-containing protein [Jiangella endophytica]|uniref:winged helix-turn-helix domain-containing protein n=1 Tax=Jiangella endophytica TaxID=1623398 RepID=UPI0018E5288D
MVGMTDTATAGTALAGLAGLLADRTRATFCLALMDGRAWTAAELASTARVARSTATEQLNLLVSGGLLAEVRQGRHRYLRLSDDAAELVEHLAAAAPPGAASPGAASPGAASPVRSLTTAHRQRALAVARTCYDHLAGTLGVAVTDAMTARGLLSWERGLTLTDDGDRWLAALVEGWPPAARRPLVRSCLDWTERRPHLGGATGAALCSHAVDAGWVVRSRRSRALRLTDVGRAALREQLGLELPDGVPSGAVDVAARTAGAARE